MGNCLVTQLKSAVDNPNLPEIGEMYFQVNEAQSGVTFKNSITFQTDDTMKITVIGDGYFGLSTSTIETDHLTEYTITSETKEFFFKNGTYKFKINNKYHLKRLYINGASWSQTSIISFDISDLQYSAISSPVMLQYTDCYGDITKAFNSATLLSDLNIVTRNDNIFGDISDFANIAMNNKFTLVGSDAIYGNISVFSTKTNLTQLNTYMLSHLEGNVQSVGALTRLTRINLSHTAVTGTLESFANGQVSAGRNSGTVVFIGNGIMTYGGTVIANESTKTIQFGSSMVNPTQEETAQGWQVA